MNALEVLGYRICDSCNGDMPPDWYVPGSGTCRGCRDRREPVTTVAYDAVLKRPGCALLQAAMGAPPSVANYFPTESWLLAPTPDLRLYPIDGPEMLAQLVTITASA